MDTRRGPTFRDFVTILTEWPMQDIAVAMQDYRVQEYRHPSPPSIKCNVPYCVKVSLRTFKIFHAQH